MGLSPEQHTVIALLEESRASIRKVGIPPEMDEGYARHLIEETVDVINLLIQIAFVHEPTPSFMLGVGRAMERLTAFRAMFNQFEKEDRHG